MAEKYRQEEVVGAVRNLIKSDGLVDIEYYCVRSRITAKVVLGDDVYEIDTRQIEEGWGKSIPPRDLRVTLNGELMYDETLEFNLGVSLYSDAFKAWKESIAMRESKRRQSEIEDKLRKQRKIDAFLAKIG